MTDRGMIFSGPMVRALLAGRKTQTRRLVRNMPPSPSDESVVHEPKHEHVYFDAYCGGKRSEANPRGMSENWCWWTRDDRAGHGCRIGFVPGDRLYVREHWKTMRLHDRVAPRDLGPTYRRSAYGSEASCPVEYLADETRAGQWASEDEEASSTGWKPGKHRQGMHMPRWASRLTLIVQDVRVEPVNSISRQDAIAEGLEDFPSTFGPSVWGIDALPVSARRLDPVKAFAELWKSLHTKEGETWEENPFVVALSFRVERGNIDRTGA